MSKKFFEKVCRIVQKIPAGKVATYGQIAEMLGTKDARKVGWPHTELSSSRGLRPRRRNAFMRGKAFGLARYVGFALHANKDPKIPCHRVVNKEGSVALNYSMGDWKEQKRKLLTEGVDFKDDMHVDLEKYLWNPVGITK